MPPIGQPDTISVVWTDSTGAPFDPTNVRVRYMGPGVAPVVVTTPDARIGRGGHPTGSGYYELTVPPQSQSGDWLYRWEALDSGNDVVGAQDGNFVFTSSPFVGQQPGSFPYPYGYILQNGADFNMVRDSLGFQAAELSDQMLGEQEFEPAGEVWIWRRVPNWRLIVALAAPAAPVLGASGSDSQLLAGTYSVRLVARVGGSSSLPGPSASITLTANQELHVTVPSDPGVQSYDGYVGVVSGGEFLQAQLVAMVPGSTVALTSYAMTGRSVAEPGLSDLTALKAATAAITASFLCRRFQRTAPAMIRTLTYSEQYKHDWRVEEAAYRANAYSYLGLISSYKITPVPGMVNARPVLAPSDPDYLEGSDPNAIPRRPFLPFP